MKRVAILAMKAAEWPLIALVWSLVGALYVLVVVGDAVWKLRKDVEAEK